MNRTAVLIGVAYLVVTLISLAVTAMGSWVLTPTSGCGYSGGSPGARRASPPGNGLMDDVAFCRWLTTEVGVAAIPPTAFYSEGHKHQGRDWVRFAFCKRRKTLEEAGERLRRVGRGA